MIKLFGLVLVAGLFLVLGIDDSCKGCPQPTISVTFTPTGVWPGATGTSTAEQTTATAHVSTPSSANIVIYLKSDCETRATINVNTITLSAGKTDSVPVSITVSGVIGQQAGSQSVNDTHIIATYHLQKISGSLDVTVITPSFWDSDGLKIPGGVYSQFTYKPWPKHKNQFLVSAMTLDTFTIYDQFRNVLAPKWLKNTNIAFMEQVINGLSHNYTPFKSGVGKGATAIDHCSSGQPIGAGSKEIAEKYITGEITISNIPGGSKINYAVRASNVLFPLTFQNLRSEFARVDDGKQNLVVIDSYNNGG